MQPVQMPNTWIIRNRLNKILLNINGCKSTQTWPSELKNTAFRRLETRCNKNCTHNEILYYASAVFTPTETAQTFYLSAAGGQERIEVVEDGAVLFVVQHDSLLHLHPLPCHYPPQHQQSIHLSPVDLVQIAEITQTDLQI